MEAKAVIKYLRISPRKVRLLADLIRGLPVNQARLQLQHSRKMAARPLLKGLESAVANAENQKMNGERLFIKAITVDGGPMLKRFKPRAFGRATPIRRRSSHITIILGEKL
jgi:large subunit ribosomal protein L22